MREIKFKAWDKKIKEMFVVHEICMHKISGEIGWIRGFGDTDKCGTDVYGGGNMQYAKENRYELMQFTGLRDKNGVEIYEGDILQMYRHCDISHKHEKDFISDVRFLRGTFCVINNRYSIECPFLNMARPGQSYEVIGNIHQNPELLLVGK